MIRGFRARLREDNTFPTIKVWVTVMSRRADWLLRHPALPVDEKLELNMTGKTRHVLCRRLEFNRSAVRVGVNRYALTGRLRHMVEQTLRAIATENHVQKLKM